MITIDQTTTASETVSTANGLSISENVQRLRNYHCIERRCMKIHAGWFLNAPAYETKYTLGYHLWDHAEHVHWLRTRLVEMRGGHPDASVAPALRALMDEALNAPDTDSMLRGLYGVIKKALLVALKEHLTVADPSANACEIRLLRRLIPEIEAQIAWYDGLKLETKRDPWQAYIRGLLEAAGGIHGHSTATGIPTGTAVRVPYLRPKTLLFDERIRIGELTAYDTRKTLDPKSATIEQFKVFFNELYAAALLATILFDSFDDGHPWEYFYDFSHHFWDEVRHSEFGATRLKEFGLQPSVCNTSLLIASEGMTVLQRIYYLTLGLEVFFMPRKQPRVKEYQKNGDLRSQLFADQDWSDETNHVRYGKRWIEHLLTDDQRTPDDIREEVQAHLERTTGKPQESICAPY
jgi:hypothetical protein